MEERHTYFTIFEWNAHTGIIFRKPDVKFEKGTPILPENALQAFCDASFASDVGFKSRIGYFFFFLGGLVSWSSSLSTRIMSSSTEAECHGLVVTGKENIWERIHRTTSSFWIPSPHQSFSR